MEDSRIKDWQIKASSVDKELIDFHNSALQLRVSLTFSIFFLSMDGVICENSKLVGNYFKIFLKFCFVFAKRRQSKITTKSIF